MPNMSYCRFENTLKDLRDCYYNMDDDNLSETEFNCRKQMIELCQSIADEFEHLLDEEYIGDKWDDEDDTDYEYEDE